MSRIRSVHPGLFTDGDVVGLSDSAQIFFIGLWTEADDYGAFEWKPVTLKIKLRGASTMPVEPLLEELRAADRIRQYEHDGRQYGVIRNFTRFQKPKFPKSLHFIPPELRRYAGSTEPITEIDGVDEAPLPPNAEIDTDERQPIPRNAEINLQMEKKEDVEGEERKKHSLPISESSPRASANVLSLEFGEFWKVYPRRQDKGHAEKAYKTARKLADQETLVAGARRYAAQRNGKDQQYTALAATWLTGKRWTDEAVEQSGNGDVAPFASPGFG